jgi:hypothetical protein
VWKIAITNSNSGQMSFLSVLFKGSMRNVHRGGHERGCRFATSKEFGTMPTNIHAWHIVARMFNIQKKSKSRTPNHTRKSPTVQSQYRAVKIFLSCKHSKQSCEQENDNEEDRAMTSRKGKLGVQGGCSRHRERGEGGGTGVAEISAQCVPVS